MSKIYKIINIAFILMLLGVCFETQIAYCLPAGSALRPPLICSKGNSDSAQETMGPERQLISHEETVSRLLIRETNKLILRFAIHKINNYLGAVPGGLDEIRSGSKESIRSSCDLYSRSLFKCLNDLSLLFEEPDLNLSFDERKLSQGIGRIIKLLKFVSLQIEKISEHENISGAKEFTQVVDEAVQRIQNFKSAINYFCDEDNVNEIISFFKENIGGNIDSMELCGEDLIFDKRMPYESFIIMGIIDNFVGTAKRVSGDKAVTSVRSGMEKENIKIEVSDTGPGMTRDILSHIFVQGFSTRTDSKEAPGQGLYLTLEYLRLKEGGIQVDTKTKDGKPLRLIFDAALKNRTILEGDEIPDDAVKRVNEGTTFTMVLPSVIPLQVARREGLALQEKMNPIVADISQSLERCLSREPEAQDLIDLSNRVRMLGYSFRNMAADLRTRTAKEKNYYLKTLLVSMDFTISHYVNNALVSMSADLTDGFQTKIKLETIKDQFMVVQKVFTGLAALQEVRIRYVSISKGGRPFLYIPGLGEDIGLYPRVVSSLEDMAAVEGIAGFIERHRSSVDPKVGL